MWLFGGVPESELTCRTGTGVKRGWVGGVRRWEPGKRIHAVVTQESRCSQDVMCAVQVTVQNTVDTH